MCSDLEYGSIIWNPSQIGYINCLNNIQFCFLRYLSYKLNCPNNGIAIKLDIHFFQA